jgi:hypothetical protein
MRNTLLFLNCSMLLYIKNKDCDTSRNPWKTAKHSVTCTTGFSSKLRCQYCKLWHVTTCCSSLNTGKHSCAYIASTNHASHMQTPLHVLFRLQKATKKERPVL